MYQKDFYALKAVFWFEFQVLAMLTRGNRRTELSLYVVFTGKACITYYAMTSFTVRFKEETAVNTLSYRLRTIYLYIYDK